MIMARQLCRTSETNTHAPGPGHPSAALVACLRGAPRGTLDVMRAPCGLHMSEREAAPTFAGKRTPHCNSVCSKEDLCQWICVSVVENGGPQRGLW